MNEPSDGPLLPDLEGMVSFRCEKCRGTTYVNRPGISPFCARCALESERQRLNEEVETVLASGLGASGGSGPKAEISDDLRRAMEKVFDPKSTAFQVLEKALRELPPKDRADALLMIRAIFDFPDCGAHFVYGIYRDNGGKSSWKDFRRTAEVFRRGDLSPSKTDVNRDRAKRRQQEMKDRAEARAKKDAERERKREERAREEREREEREREKETAMTTIRREDLYKTQQVWVRVRYAGHLKLTPARVLDVVRAAAQVQIEGEKAPRLVRFNEISLTGHEEQEQAVAPGHHGGLTAVPPAFQGLGEGRGVQQMQQNGGRHPYVERRHAPSQPIVETRRQVSQPPQISQPPPPAAPPPSALDQVAAWIEQGSGMRENLLKQREALQEEMDNLALEALKIEEALKTKKAEHGRVDTLLKALDQMRGTVAA